MNLIGDSPVFRRAVAQATRFARSQISVLLIGETGSGKELLAQYIHCCSGRQGRFVDVNCGAFPRDIVESLLFGHRRGAFTGAVEDSTGLVAQADGGTLFLDELSSLPLEAQAKLLRVLETRELRRLGDVVKRSVDFRIVAAVQEDFGERVRAGFVRQDLYQRLAGVEITLPPLRCRPEDVALLAQHFAAGHQRSITASALSLLNGYSWPGNVRELRTVIERAAILSDEQVLSARAICEALNRNDGEGIADPPMRTQLLAICAQHNWNPVRIAGALSVSRATLYRRLRLHGIRLREVSKSHKVSACLETL